MAKIKVTVSDKHMGGYDEMREVESPEELNQLRNEFKKYPQARDFSTTITFSGIINGEVYFEQIL